MSDGKQIQESRLPPPLNTPYAERMDYAICEHGKIEAGATTVTLNRDETTLIIKHVPADICDNCGEYYLSEVVTEHLLQLGEDAINHGAEIEVLRYTA